MADFAVHFAIPVDNLKQLLELHHERDQLVRQSLHEQVAFIKMSEGHPLFLSHNATQENSFRFSEASETIGILDFFESLQIMPRLLACIERVNKEI